MSRLAFACPVFDVDFVRWAQYQIKLIREREFAQLDIDKLLDELAFIVSSRKNAIKDRLRVLILLSQFRKAVNDAMLETTLPRSAFPDTLPYSTDQLLDHSFMP